MFAGVVADQSSLEDDVLSSTFFLSPFLKVIPLGCLGVDFPPVRLPVCVFISLLIRLLFLLAIPFGATSWVALL